MIEQFGQWHRIQSPWGQGRATDVNHRDQSQVEVILHPQPLTALV